MYILVSVTLVHTWTHTRAADKMLVIVSQKRYHFFVAWALLVAGFVSVSHAEVALSGQEEKCIGSTTVS